MLFPKKTKYRKWQTGRKTEERRTRPTTRGITVAFGSHGLKALSQARVTSNQIEAARRVAVRHLGKTGKIWIRIFPDRPFTKKASEMPMGKGKGEPEGFVCEVRPGRVIMEVDGAPEAIAKEALIKATKKLPVLGRVVVRK